MGNEPQTLTEMPLWVLILLAALGGVSGEMWRADKAGLGGWALLRRLALRSGASIVCGVAVMLLALACGAALLFAAALGSLTAAALQAHSIQSLQPQPLRSHSWRGGLELEGRLDEDGRLSLFLTLLPNQLGEVASRLEFAGESLAFDQFIYP